MECPNTFKCKRCGETYHKGVTDEEASKEAEFYFGVPNAINDSRFVVVCDPCFQKMHPADYPELTVKARQELKKRP